MPSDADLSESECEVYQSGNSAQGMNDSLRGELSVVYKIFCFSDFI